jgi:hypothetical protein
VRKLGVVFLALLFSTIFSTSGCARKAAPEAAASADRGATEDVVTSLEVKVGRDSVELILHATNPTSQAVSLQFSSGQRYDFMVLDGQGREVWRWSADKMFTQALGTEVLAPGQGLQYRAVWPSAGRNGQFVAVARITALERRLEQRTEFEVAR